LESAAVHGRVRRFLTFVAPQLQRTASVEARPVSGEGGPIADLTSINFRAAAAAFSLPGIKRRIAWFTAPSRMAASPEKVPPVGRVFSGPVGSGLQTR
jgi:hypothetical protein